MRKIVSILGLSSMLALQVFQLCDESHDACEALRTKFQTVSYKTFSYTAPASVNDPDADFPLVLGQTLYHEELPAKQIWSVILRHPFLR